MSVCQCCVPSHDVSRHVIELDREYWHLPGDLALSIKLYEIQQSEQQPCSPRDPLSSGHSQHSEDFYPQCSTGWTSPSSSHSSSVPDSSVGTLAASSRPAVRSWQPPSSYSTDKPQTCRVARRDVWDRLISSGTGVLDISGLTFWNIYIKLELFHEKFNSLLTDQFPV